MDGEQHVQAAEQVSGDADQTVRRVRVREIRSQVPRQRGLLRVGAPRLLRIVRRPSGRDDVGFCGEMLGQRVTDSDATADPGD
jgi:hypothetical protein